MNTYLIGVKWERGLAAKPDHLSSIPRTHMMEGGSHLLHVVEGVCSHTRLMNKCNKIMKVKEEMKAGTVAQTCPTGQEHLHSSLKET